MSAIFFKNMKISYKLWGLTGISLLSFLIAATIEEKK